MPINTKLVTTIGSQYEHILLLFSSSMSLSLPLARQSSSDVPDISEVDSRPLGVYLLNYNDYWS